MKLMKNFLGVMFLSVILIPGCWAVEITSTVVEKSSVGEPIEVLLTATVPDVEVTTPAKVQVSQPGNVSLDFRDADIKNVLKILAFKSGMNIVAGPEVTGIVTIQLNDVPWEEALDVILKTYGYSYEKKGKILSVMTVDELKKRREDSMLLADQEPLMTKTFRLKFAKAKEVIGAIAKMKTERGSMDLDERTNTLIVTDISARMKLIEGVIDDLDKTTPQVLIEGKIIETRLGDDDKLGIDWGISGTASGAARPISFPFPGHASSDMTTDSFPAVAKTDLLFKWGTLDVTGFSATLDILSSRSNTEILSNPRIVTLDNQPAEISVGEQYPIPSYTYNEEQNKMAISGWSYLDIGIIFKVTPHVNNEEFVTLDVEPKVTERGESVTVADTDMPIISNESVKTQVLVKSGDTLVIGGLIKNKKGNDKSHVPFLHKIPLLGQFFKHSSVTNNKTDLLIFITPHIITPDVTPTKNKPVAAAQ